MSSSTDKIDKGGEAEEALREYFRSLGSFVIRGVPVREGREHVTDIDLWVYTRSSVHARHISIVDVKNKKRAKGCERAIWVKGLQSTVGANEAIIATTAQHTAIMPFASRLGVRVLSGSALRAIINRYGKLNDRLSNEELFEQWKSIQLRAPQTVKTRIDDTLVELGQGISFSSLNSWVDEAASLFSIVVDRERQPGAILRAAYFCSGLVALGADFLGRELSFADSDLRIERFRQGLMFGRADPGASRRYITFAEKIVTEYFDPTGAAAAAIRSGFEESVSRLPINGLVEFFAKPAAGKELIDAAIALEAAAFAKRVPYPSDLRTEARVIIGLLLDFAKIPRSTILGSPSVNTVSLHNSSRDNPQDSQLDNSTERRQRLDSPSLWEMPGVNDDRAQKAVLTIRRPPVLQP